MSENEEKTTPVPQTDEGIQAEDDKKPEEPPAVIEATVEAISHVPVASLVEPVEVEMTPEIARGDYKSEEKP